jgi:hypothetical protein
MYLTALAFMLIPGVVCLISEFLSCWLERRSMREPADMCRPWRAYRCCNCVQSLLVGVGVQMPVIEGMVFVQLHVVRYAMIS